MASWPSAAGGGSRVLWWTGTGPCLTPLCIIYMVFLDLKGNEFMEKQLLLVLLFFGTLGGCRQRAEAMQGERRVVSACRKPRQAALAAARNTAIHKMWHSCWRDTAGSLFYSVIKTTSVRVHLLVAGSVGRSRRANLLRAGDRIGSVERAPRVVVAHYLLEEFLLHSPVTQSLILRGAGRDTII